MMKISMESMYKCRDFLAKIIFNGSPSLSLQVPISDTPIVYIYYSIHNTYIRYIASKYTVFKRYNITHLLNVNICLWKDLLAFDF